MYHLLMRHVPFGLPGFLDVLGREPTDGGVILMVRANWSRELLAWVLVALEELVAGTAKRLGRTATARVPNISGRRFLISGKIVAGVHIRLDVGHILLLSSEFLK